MYLQTTTESNEIRPQMETDRDALTLPDAQRQEEMSQEDNSRKRRKIGEGDMDKGTPVTQTNKVKGLTIKEMLQKMHLRGKKKEQL